MCIRDSSKVCHFSPERRPFCASFRRRCVKSKRQRTTSTSARPRRPSLPPCHIIPPMALQGHSRYHSVQKNFSCGRQCFSFVRLLTLLDRRFRWTVRRLRRPFERRGQWQRLYEVGFWKAEDLPADAYQYHGAHFLRYAIGSVLRAAVHPATWSCFCP